MGGRCTSGLGTFSSRWGIVALGIYCVCCPSVAQSQTSVPPLNVISGTVTILNDRDVEVEDLSNVVVFVDGLAERYTGQSDVPIMSHLGRRFTPRVLPLVQGDAVDFLNDDNIYHNVFSLSKANTFDLGIYPQGTSKVVIFDEPGLVRIYCNIHPNMISTIVVLNNTLFDITGPDGTFEIRNVPAGEITLRVWSEFGEEISRRVVVGGGSRLEESFIVRETNRLTDHNNKFGRPYRDKY